MRIQNNTRWDTESLRYIVGRCLEERNAATGRRVKSRSLWVTVKAGREGVRVWAAAFRLHLPNPPVDFDPSSDEHTDRVIMLVRRIDWAICMIAGGKPNRETATLERPIVWLADWYSVNRGPKGVAAGCPVSPLMPAKAPDKSAAKVALLDHAERMLRKASTRCKRAETLRKKWARKVARLRG